MDITLYYIEGISRIDTPYFATKTSQASISKQEEFFDNHIVAQVNMGYYPPHYRNSIRFDSEDLVINDNVNYLSLDYQGKRYYYFIDSITYISESIIELDISMDVIQTFMFDIYISNGIIERKFINRWKYSSGEWKINRSYIRENVSSNEYVYYSNTIVNEDIKQWLVFVPCSSYYNIPISNIVIKYDGQLPGFAQGSEFVSAYPFYILPYFKTDYSGDTYNEASDGSIVAGATAEDVDVDATYNFSFYSSRNYVVDMYVCPFNCAKNLILAYDSINAHNVLDIGSDGKKYFIVRHSFSQGSYGNLTLFTVTVGNEELPTTISYVNRKYTGKFTSKVMTSNMSFGFSTRNTSVGTNYDSKYIMQMLDENYIMFKFGSLTAYTALPLFLLEKDTCYCNYAFNPSDGTRIYWVSPYSTGNDIYNTVTVDTNILHFDLKNDPWVDYVSQNRSRWFAAIANTALTIYTKGMYNSTTAKFAKDEIKDVLSNSANYDKRYKDPHLKKKPAKIVSNRQQDLERGETSMMGEVLNSSNENILGQAFKDINVRMTPPTAKQIANISGITARQAYIMKYVERVNDYEQCAQYYHRNGYLVNEYINASSHIFADVQNRYYFNMLKMQLPNVHLHNIIEDEDTIEAISDRLVDGVRLWNVNNNGVTLGDFSKDNVEYDFLS